MEHAIRHHIRQHIEQDPVHYGKLSEHLEEILKTFGEKWEQLALALKSLAGEAHEGRQADDSGLDPQTQSPFYAVMKQEREKEKPTSGADQKWLAGLTVRLVDTIRNEVRMVGFWKNSNAQQVLRGAIFTFLDDNEVVPFERADIVADRLLELSKANHERLVKQ